MSDVTKALEIFTQTKQQLHDLEIPDKRTVDALVNSAMRAVAVCLASKNLQGAKDVHDKLGAAEKYLRAKVSQQLADRITQNTVAAGRYRVIREIGQWCIDNVNHKSGPDSGLVHNELNKQISVLVELGIGHATYWRWMETAKMSEEEFEAWLAPYLDLNIPQNMELYWSLLWHFVHPSHGAGKQQSNPPISLQPHMLLVWVCIEDLKDALQNMAKEMCKGETPINQVRFIYGQLSQLIEEIKGAKAKNRGVY